MEGLKIRRIARILKRLHSTIIEEITRNKQVYEKRYCAETAHERFLKRQNNNGNVKN